MEIDQDQAVMVSADKVVVSDFMGNIVEHPKTYTVDWDASAAEKGGWDSFMDKEIHEDPAAVQRTLLGRLDENGNINLDEVRIDEHDFKAIDKISFEIPRKKVIGVVGESGSGKSVTMKAAMGILAKNATVNSGSIQFSYHHADGSPETVDLLQKDKKWIRRHINGKRIAMVFQDPMTSLDPTMPIGKQIMEGMLWHYKMPKDAAYKKAVQLLEEVGITDAEKRMKSYPHQLSGGMRQRVMIAMALSCNPKLIIADEPTTALDVTIQAQILDLLRNLKDKINSSIMLITHDLGVIAEMADYVVVMYAGRVVEKGTAEEIFANPAHPYTIGLMASKPVVGKKVDKLYSIPGKVPNPINMPDYCYFKDRCEMQVEKCSGEYPHMIQLSPTHMVSCYRYFDGKVGE